MKFIVGGKQGPAGPPGLSSVDVVAVMQQVIVVDSDGDLVFDDDGDVVFSEVLDE